MNKLLLVFEGVGMALEAIRTNKVRAALTIAGLMSRAGSTLRRSKVGWTCTPSSWVTPAG